MGAVIAFFPAGKVAELMPIISAIQSNMPQAVYWMSWDGKFSMGSSYNTGIEAVIANPWVITRDEVPPLGRSIVRSSAAGAGNVKSIEKKHTEPKR